MQFDSNLRDEYHALFQSCAVDPKRKEEVEHAITTILRGGKRYSAVGSALDIPWHVIGCIHFMECSCNFNLHLHNGDPLSSPTVNVPKGRPPAPWPIPGASADDLWFASAIDALKLDGFDSWSNWTIEGTLYAFERYNGFGYRKHGIHSPYLWSGAPGIYAAGKYVSDGQWSPTAVSKQIGAGAILRRMVDQSLIEIEPTPNRSTTIDDIPFASA